MGHLMLIEKAGNVSQALTVCDVTNLQARYECYSGVFMENIYRRNLEEHGVSHPFPWNEQTFLEQKQLCSEQSDLASKACWRELSHMMVALSHNNVRQTVNDCNQAQDTAAKEACILHSMGILILVTEFTPSNMTNLCKAYVQYEDTCITMVVQTTLASSSSFYPKVKEFCTALPKGKQEKCNVELQSKSKMSSAM
jgi:hypothetical protein